MKNVASMDSEEEENDFSTSALFWEIKPSLGRNLRQFR